MTEKERQALADLLRSRRLELGLSARELARRAGIDNATITLLEQCKVIHPRVDTIQAMAEVLEIPLADIYAVTNWLPEGALPSLRPYMRAKYEDLPEAALADIERYVERLSIRHRRGPLHGEDE